MATNKGPKKAVTSSVCLIPPEAIWPTIQEIRRVHDKSFYRWMPHINLLYPFVPNNELPTVLERVKAAVSGIQPFKVTYSTFKHFQHSPKSLTMWLHPEPSEPVITLQAKLWEAFPFYNDQNTKNEEESFVPHLSVGQWTRPNQMSASKQEFQKEWKSLTYEVTGVHIITRIKDEPFDVRYFIDFNGTITPKNVVEERQRDLRSSLYARNLPFNTTEEVIKAAVEAKGFKVRDVTIMRDGAHRSKGFGFVEFDSPEILDQASVALTRIEIENREVMFSPARVKPE